MIGATWRPAWLAVLLVVCLGHAARAGDADEAPSLRDLFEKAVKTTGKDYFAAKEAFLSREDARDTAMMILTDPKLTWGETMVARSIREQLDDPVAWQVLLKSMALFAYQRTRGESRLGFPADVASLWYGNPKALDRDSEARQVFEAWSDKVGLLAEVLRKHSPDSMAEVTWHVRSEDLSGWWKERSERPGGAKAKVGAWRLWGWRTDTGSVVRWPRRERELLLVLARRLAARALVLVGDDDAVRLIEEMGKEKVHRYDAPRALEWIGTDSAIRALEDMPWPEAERALRRLEAKKAGTTKPASGKERALVPAP